MGETVVDGVAVLVLEVVVGEFVVISTEVVGESVDVPAPDDAKDVCRDVVDVSPLVEVTTVVVKETGDVVAAALVLEVVVGESVAPATAVGDAVNVEVLVAKSIMVAGEVLLV